MENLLEYQKALGIAAETLRKTGEVNLSEIESLPFLDRDFDTKIITNALRQMFNVEVIQRKVSTTPYLQWQEVIRLKMGASRP